jgi:hypothetical protein
MQLSNDGLTVWYGTEDTPIDAEGMTVGVAPAHPANAVTVRYRTGDRRSGISRARSCSRFAAGPRQYFRADLPALAAGSWIEVIPIVTCAGRQSPSPGECAMPSAWLRYEAPLTADDPVRDDVAKQAARAAPRFPARLEFLGHVTVTLLQPPEDIGVVAQGLRRNIYHGGGRGEGPALNGTIRAVGGDWLLIQRDGVALPNVRATWDTADGAVLFSDYSGVFDLGPAGYDNALAGRFPKTPPLRLAPRFVTADARYQWLNRLQCVGIGQVDMSELVVEYDLYAATAGEPIFAARRRTLAHG